MKFETNLQHALTVMLDLEINKDSGFTRAADIAERNKLPARLTTLLVYQLKASGLIRLTKGYKGSYKLCKTPDKIKIKDIFQAVGENYKFKSKLKAISPATTAMKDFFAMVLMGLKNSLKDYTLEDLIKDYRDSHAD